MLNKEYLLRVIILSILMDTPAVWISIVMLWLMALSQLGNIVKLAQSNAISTTTTEPSNKATHETIFDVLNKSYQGIFATASAFEEK